MSTPSAAKSRSDSPTSGEAPASGEDEPISRDQLGGEELSHAQFELLIELWERGELSAGDLAAAARLSPATVTQMLDHLADSGHVERVRSPIDRRVVVTRLTPKGAEKIEAKHAAWQSRWAQAMAGLDLQELRRGRAS
jgi:DNA-binding MarR family transcriptional regulator